MDRGGNSYETSISKKTQQKDGKLESWTLVAFQFFISILCFSLRT